MTYAHEDEIVVEGSGKTMKAAFIDVARELFSVMVEIDSVKPKKMVNIFAEGETDEELLVNWVQALLDTADMEGMVFCSFTIKKLQHGILNGTAKGEKRAVKRFRKATYSIVEVGKKNNVFVVKCSVVK